MVLLTILFLSLKLIVTIDSITLKSAKNIHTSFYSVYASAEDFSPIDFKVRKDQVTGGNFVSSKCV